MREGPGRWRRHDSEPVGIWVCRYVYTDVDGIPLHATVRFRDPKSFRQERFEHGRWSWGLNGVLTVPYRLPALVRAPDALVFVTEGEQDADRLASLGLVATTVPANAWRSWHAGWFTGRDVAICEDNDEAGRLIAARVRATIEPVCRRLQVVSFHEMHEGADVSDWLNAGGRIEMMLAGLGFREALRVEERA